MNNEESTEEAIEEDEPSKPRRRRRKNGLEPKRGLGPVVTRKRRNISDAIEDRENKRKENERKAAEQEMERLKRRYNDRMKEDSRWAASLIKAVISNQTMLLRLWGHRQAVETQVRPSGRVVAWTNFKKIRIEWPLDRVPNRMHSSEVLDTVAQAKGVMQHEMGHIRFTTSWKTIKKNSIEPEVTP